MHSSWILFLFIFLSLVRLDMSRASEHYLELVEINNTVYSINTSPLELLWNGSSHLERPHMLPISTAHGDFVACWRVENENLVLIEFQARSARNGKALSATQAIGAQLPKVAEWFTGTILAAKGENSSGMYGNIDAALLLVIENGRVLKTIEEPKVKFRSDGRIGLTLKSDGTHVLVGKISNDGPAEHSGVFSNGDVLLAIDSTGLGYRSLEGLSAEHAADLMCGPKGLSIHIFFRTTSGEKRKVQLSRE